MEMVVVIVILGIAIPILMRMWADVSWRSVHSEIIADGVFFAQSLLEEVKSKRFDEKTALPWSNAGTFASADAGENKNNKDTFDDVDDFVGATDPKVTTPASGYVCTVAVKYVRPLGNTWQDCSVSCDSSTDCAQCSACCYKNIRVSVSRPGTAATDISVETLMSAY